MKKMNDAELKEKVRLVLEKKYPASLNELGRLIGYKKISGSTVKRIKTLLPGIEKLLKGNRTIQDLESPAKKSTTPTNIVKKPAVKSTKSPIKKAVKKSNYPQNPKNPFRLGSSYGKCWQLLYKHINGGIHKSKLIKALAEATGKSEERAYYDAMVLLSARDSNSGKRHRSCKEGFWVKKENDHVVLMID